MLVIKMSSTSQEVDHQAARWAVLRDFGPLAPEQQEQFERWLSADKRHLGAYARAEGTLVRVDRANGGVLSDGPMLQPAQNSGWRRRNVLLAGAAAASVSTVAYIAARGWNSAGEQVFATGMGQVREVLLVDGSVITLNTNSKVAVRYTAAARDISLVQGEALFDVAKDKARPFIVQADNTFVRAVGTSFTVSMLPQKPIQVLVREGTVEVKRKDLTPSAPLRVSANTKAVAPSYAPISTAAIPAEKLVRDLAWKSGRLAFDDETLEEAANEYARYSDIRIVVEPEVSRKTITGVFVSNDPIGFANGAAAVLGLAVEVNGREVKIMGRSGSNG